MDWAADELAGGREADYEHIQIRGERELRRKYQLTNEQLQAIKMEGIRKDWPMP